MAVYAGGILVAWVRGLFSPHSLAAVTSIWTDYERTMLYLSLLAISCSVSAAKYLFWQKVVDQVYAASKQ